MTAAPRADRSARVKASIHAAAARLFEDRGFTATSVRDIAREAGCDPALVIRHFGSKEGLFLESVSVSEFWTSMLDGPIEELGERVARTLIEARGERLGGYTALIRASDLPEVRARLQASSMATFIEPVLRRLGGADAEMRAHLFAALVDGLLTAIAVREDPVLFEAPVDELVAWYAPLLQQSLDPRSATAT